MPPQNDHPIRDIVTAHLGPVRRSRRESARRLHRGTDRLSNGKRAVPGQAEGIASRDSGARDERLTMEWQPVPRVSARRREQHRGNGERRPERAGAGHDRRAPHRLASHQPLRPAALPCGTWAKEASAGTGSDVAARLARRPRRPCAPAPLKGPTAPMARGARWFQARCR
ncbi:unnamed protein product [Lampetra planeri]